LKVAITGHTSGVGQSLATAFSNRGHTIIGLCRSNGYDISNIDKIVPIISDCDMFVNCAQFEFYQSALLFEIWKLWEGSDSKRIVNVSSAITLVPLETQTLEKISYLNQKQSLETMNWNLVAKNPLPRMCLLKPFKLNKETSWESWSNFVVSIIENLEFNSLELSIGLER
jgi:hypothetical protein